MVMVHRSIRVNKDYQVIVSGDDMRIAVMLYTGNNQLTYNSIRANLGWIDRISPSFYKGNLLGASEYKMEIVFKERIKNCIEATLEIARNNIKNDNKLAIARDDAMKMEDKRKEKIENTVNNVIAEIEGI
jgi:hypothetical protein